MHHIERHAPWEEIWGAFEALVNQGKAYYIGSSNFEARHLAYAQAMAEKRNFLGLVNEWAAVAAKKLTEAQRTQLEAYSSLCKELGESEANVALAWILANPAITAPIIGPRTLEQFEDTLRAVEIELSDEVLKKLDEIFPGPGGEAPEAYAW